MKVCTGARKSSALVRGAVSAGFGVGFEALGDRDGLGVALLTCLVEGLAGFGNFGVDLGVAEELLAFLERRETRPSIDLF